MILMPTLVTLIGFGGKLTAAIIMIGAMVRHFCISCMLQRALKRVACWSTVLMASCRWT